MENAEKSPSEAGQANKTEAFCVFLQKKFKNLLQNQVFWCKIECNYDAVQRAGAKNDFL
ncbi:MAG: hypothetical protein IIW78_01415 [Clostridia bacterium]|nr:hypothetical protein [Clostridia bacterium]MBQ5892892.1 hypothetical protein [Clostridia bacterium]